MPLSSGNFRWPLLLMALLSARALADTPAFDPVAADPAPDAEHPAAFSELTLPSHGAELYGVYYRAAGAVAHPTVLMLHGFPGYEQNEDLAQALRRGGYNVLIFHYRGAWGSHGTYSFTHCIEDVEAVLAYLRMPAHAASLGVDPRRLVLVGHSVGGHLAGIVAARDPRVLGVALVSAANRRVAMARPGWDEQIRAHFQAEVGPLHGADGAALSRELRTHARLAHPVVAADAVLRAHGVGLIMRHASRAAVVTACELGLVFAIAYEIAGAVALLAARLSDLCLA